MRAVFWIWILAACTSSSPDPVPDDIECPGQLEVCLVRDSGWNAWCEGGIVYIDDLTGYGYCKPGDPRNIVCEVGGAGNAQQVLGCTTGCSGETKYIETIDEFHQFDPATLCGP